MLPRLKTILILLFVSGIISACSITSDYPVYPKSVFVEKIVNPACSTITDKIEQDMARGFYKCDSIQYVYQSTDELAKVVKWYTDGSSGSGWKLSGGGGAEGIERYGKFSNGIKSYWLYVGLGQPDSDSKTKFEIRIPNF